MNSDKDADSGWTEKRLKDVLAFFGRHLVAMCGSYVDLDKKGKPIGSEKFYCLTGFVVEIRNCRCIATAGHVLRSIEDAVRTGHIRIIGQSLVDYFGPEARHTEAIPFAILDQPYVYVDDDDLKLDFGVVGLSQIHSDLIEANGVVPFFLDSWSPPPDTDFYRYWVLGFPAEHVEGLAASGGKRLSASINLVMVPVEKLRNSEGGAFSRFKGRITTMGNQRSMKGMSGGPILGFAHSNGGHRYWVVAIQSSWEESGGIVYGCPVPEFMRVIEDEYSKMKNKQ